MSDVIHKPFLADQFELRQHHLRRVTRPNLNFYVGLKIINIILLTEVKTINARPVVSFDTFYTAGK